MMWLRSAAGGPLSEVAEGLLYSRTSTRPCMEFIVIARYDRLIDSMHHPTTLEQPPTRWSLPW